MRSDGALPLVGAGEATDARRGGGRAPRVLLLSRYGWQGASSRLRMLQFVPMLQAMGFSISVQSLLDDAALQRRYRSGGYGPVVLAKAYARRVRAMLDRGAHDLAWIEKEALPWLPASLERLLLRRMPCVLDYDDAVFHGYDRHRSGAVRMLLGQRIDRLMRAARVVVAGNEYLAARARSAGAQSVAVVPTVVDLAHYPEGEHRQAGGQVPRVAWIGSPSTSAYLSLVSAPLAEVAREFPFILRVIGGGNVSLPGVEVESIAWSESDESRLLRECSIGIMPLPDEPWERGKCGYKLVQYMACGLPVMASPVGANVALVDGQGVGFLAGDAGEWASGLRTLLGNAPLRRRMGARGREHVERKYSAQVQVDRIADLLSGAIA